MTPEETAAFFAGGPVGAVCVADPAGRLLALPAGVVAGDDAVLTITTRGDVFDAHAGDAAAVCVVADVFTSYAGIRGVIAQGSIDPHGGTSDPDVRRVALVRTVTFSFANASVAAPVPSGNARTGRK